MKGNQGTMHQAVIDHIREQWEDDFAGVEVDRHQTTKAGHGHQENRTYIQMPVPRDLPGFESWPGLRSIGIVASESVRDGKRTDDVRYYVSSLEVGVKRFAAAVRSHWLIENTRHRTSDMKYREDESRIREEHLRENFAWLNRPKLSLLKQPPGRESVAMKRRSCS